MNFFNWLFKRKGKKEAVSKDELKIEANQAIEKEEAEVAAVIAAVIASIKESDNEDDIIAAIAASLYEMEKHADMYETAAIAASIITSMEEDLKEAV